MRRRRQGGRRKSSTWHEEGMVEVNEVGQLPHRWREIFWWGSKAAMKNELKSLDDALHNSHSDAVALNLAIQDVVLHAADDDAMIAKDELTTMPPQRPAQRRQLIVSSFPSSCRPAAHRLPTHLQSVSRTHKFKLNIALYPLSVAEGVHQRRRTCSSREMHPPCRRNASALPKS